MDDSIVMSRVWCHRYHRISWEHHVNRSIREIKDGLLNARARNDPCIASAPTGAASLPLRRSVAMGLTDTGKLLELFTLLSCFAWLYVVVKTISVRLYKQIFVPTIVSGLSVPITANKAKQQARRAPPPQSP